MTELKKIEMIRRLAGPASPIGDDCAVLEWPGSREDFLVTTDLFLEDVHFLRRTHGPADAGRKALARGLSDIAAMGGTPRWCFVSLALAAWADEKWLRGFYAGLLALARRNGVELAGGDLARDRRLACDVTVIGSVPRGKALRRSGAKAGDGIYVSGVLGGSSLGLLNRRGKEWKRHLHPEPRLELGRYLRGKATACMDLSDGLSIDLHRLCVESGLAAVLDRPLPVFHGAGLDQALHGGEDYELLFTAPSGKRIPALWGGLPLTRIGTMESGKAGAIDFFGQKLKPKGYDHFQQL
ncbi:MAG: thiamine-phosphate kinase [Acidobacteriia bacterium]|nr:thiamine-phosphate kinase [Terriglobia bacterium]